MPRRRGRSGPPGDTDSPGNGMAPIPQTPPLLKEATYSLRRYVRDLIEGQPSVHQSQVEQAAFDRYRNDPRFMDRLLRENVRIVVTSVVTGVISSTRSKPMVLHGDELVERDVLVARLEAAAENWASWLEWTGDRHVRLPEMTAEDLEAAAAIREERGKSDLHRAALWRRLAARLRSDGLDMVQAIPNWSAEVEKLSIGTQITVSSDWRDWFDWSSEDKS